MIGPIWNRPVGSPLYPAQRPAFTPVSRYRGVNLDRQTRFGARATRRDGDWGILGVSAAFLWLEEESVLTCPDPLLCVAPPIIDLWP